MAEAATGAMLATILLLRPALLVSTVEGPASSRLDPPAEDMGYRLGCRGGWSVAVGGDPSVPGALACDGPVSNASTSGGAGLGLVTKGSSVPGSTWLCGGRGGNTSPTLSAVGSDSEFREWLGGVTGELDCRRERFSSPVERDEASAMLAAQS